MVRQRRAIRIPEDPLSGMELPYPLRSYQREGVTFFIQNQSALLADEMGLGKTVQTILAIRFLAHVNLCRRVLSPAAASHGSGRGR